jgi:hypothetical protein
MPDITMCVNKNCSESQNCYRFLAKPNRYQSYSTFENSCNKENNYEYKIELKKKENN